MSRLYQGHEFSGDGLAGSGDDLQWTVAVLNGRMLFLVQSVASTMEFHSIVLPVREGPDG